MPDPIATPTDKTSALDAGHTTTEYQLTKWITILTAITGVLSAIVPFIEQAKAVFGDTKWITIVSLALATLTPIVYTLQRSAIKLAAINAGQKVDVAAVTPAAGDAAAGNVGAAK